MEIELSNFRKEMRLDPDHRSRLNVTLELKGRRAENQFGFSLEVDGFAPMRIYCRFDAVHPLLETVARNLPEAFDHLSWREQVQHFVRLLERLGGKDHNATTALGLYLACTCPSPGSKSLPRHEWQGVVDNRPVHLVMAVDAEGGAEVAFDEDEITLVPGSTEQATSKI